MKIPNYELDFEKKSIVYDPNYFSSEDIHVNQVYIRNRPGLQET